jgi:NAD-dependent dihydropyrimidine dehydrogenase PreA subunit
MILLCQCTHAHRVPASTLKAVLAGLREAGQDVTVVPDLCEACVRGDETVAHWAATEAAAVGACFPRAVRWLLHRAGIGLSADAVLANLRADAPADVLAMLTASGDQPKQHGHGGSNNNPGAPGPRPCHLSGKAVPPSDGPPEGWAPWFPVIDYERCKGCRRCVNFCLFGVYAQQGDTVAVARPWKCKTNCPACARVCPEIAIIFPKYNAGPINGDVHIAPGEQVRVDPSVIRGGYEKLKKRQGK